jgi:single-stranded DNA-binding protein
MGFNVVVLSGRLTADPEIRMGTNDTKIARYTLALIEKKERTQSVKPTLYHA